MRSKGLSNNISHKLYGGHIALCPYTLYDKFHLNASNHVLHVQISLNILLLTGLKWSNNLYGFMDNIEHSVDFMDFDD